MKVTTIENLVGNTFHYRGEEFTVSGFGQHSGISATSENGRMKMFDENLEVVQDFIPNPKTILEAYQYTKAFEDFACSRMTYLYMILDTSPFFVKSHKEAELDYTSDGEGRQDMYIIYRYGYHETGSFETERIHTSMLTVSFDEWDEYCKLRKQEKDAKEALRKSQNALAAQEKKYQEYLKLKEEFKDA